jgi:hypothetical protein
MNGGLRQLQGETILNRNIRDWLANRWAQAIVPIAAGVSPVFLWLRRGDQLRSELTIECTLVRPREADDWVTADIIVRNFRPYPLHVAELHLLRPRGAKICSDAEDPFWTQQFLAPSLDPISRAVINTTIKPYGMSPDYLQVGAARIYVSEGDSLSRRFRIRLPVSGNVRIKMALICELRAPALRKLRIPIKRTFTASTIRHSG